MGFNAGEVAEVLLDFFSGSNVVEEFDDCFLRIGGGVSSSFAISYSAGKEAFGVREPSQRCPPC